MTSLLISVTNVQEAQIAIAGGANIIDLKDPANGALGALPDDVIIDVANDVAGRRKVSATIGDLPMNAALIQTRVSAFMQMPLDYIKIGFFVSDDYRAVLDGLADLIKQGAQLIAVLFAEYQYSPDLIQQLKQVGFIGVMLDTSNKDGLTLFSHYTGAQISTFCEAVIDANLLLGLAGSLNATHMHQLKPLKPDYLGFRGGVCVGNDRKQQLQLAKIQAIGKLM